MNYYEFTGRQWEGSKEQAYLNSLRQNIAQSTPFNPNDTENKSLRALAIYILKGDNIDDMMNYIQITGVDDYSMAFGLWGINVGYSDIPKTFITRTDLPSDKMLKCYIKVIMMAVQRTWRANWLFMMGICWFVEKDKVEEISQ